MAQKTAVCTVVLGQRYQRLFREVSLEGWRRYCQVHSYQLVVFERSFRDLGPKSLAWQKLFVLDQPELSSADKVIWLDADILIRAGAPAVEVPSGLIGYVPEVPVQGTVGEWYREFDLSPADEVVQTGVLCLEHSHAEILTSVADAPETSMFEMPALSHRISSAGVGYRLDPRFNALLAPQMLRHVPLWVLQNKRLKEALWLLGYPPLRRALREICDANWFIHAAGAKRDLLKASSYLARKDRALAERASPF